MMLIKWGILKKCPNHRGTLNTVTFNITRVKIMSKQDGDACC